MVVTSDGDFENAETVIKPRTTIDTHIVKPFQIRFISFTPQFLIAIKLKQHSRLNYTEYFGVVTVAFNAKIGNLFS